MKVLPHQSVQVVTLMNQEQAHFAKNVLKNMRKNLKKRVDFIMKCAIIKIDRGSDVKNYRPVKNGHCPLFLTSAEMPVGEATTLLAGTRFSLRKEFP